MKRPDRVLVCVAVGHLGGESEDLPLSPPIRRMGVKKKEKSDYRQERTIN